MNNNYNAPEEDLEYFKEIFENLVFNKKLHKIFDAKFKKFFKRNNLAYWGLVIFNGLMILSYSFSRINPDLTTSCILM